jgi:hypothetical protein
MKPFICEQIPNTDRKYCSVVLLRYKSVLLQDEAESLESLSEQLDLQQLWDTLSACLRSSVLSLPFLHIENCT